MEAGHAGWNQADDGGKRLESGKIYGLHAEFRGQDPREVLLGDDGLLDHDVVYLAPRVDRLGEEFLGGGFVECSRAPEDVDDLVRIHVGGSLSDCPPWCWR